MNRTNQALIAVWALIAAFIGFMVVDLVNARRDAEARVRDQAVNYVRLIEQHAAAAFERSNIALIGVDEHLRPGDLLGKGRLPEKRRREIDALLLSQQQRTAGVGLMFLADAEGRLLAQSVGESSGVNVRDRTHFQALQRDPQLEVAISEAVLGRVTGKWGVAIGRRIDLPDGSFGGMIGANLSLDENFIDFYSSLHLGKDGAITLRDPDNRLLVRHPAVEGKLGQPVATTGWIRDRLRAGDKEGVISIASNIDGIERVFAFRRLAKYPIYAAVGLSLEEVFSGWRSERNALALGALLLAAAGAFITVALRRSQRAARELAVSEARFRGLAEQSLVGILLYGEEGIQYANPGIARIFGYAQEKIQGLALLDLVADKDKARVAAAVRERLSGVVPHGHYTAQGMRQDGSAVELEIFSSRMQVDASPVIVTILVDITERRRAEDALASESFRNRMLLHSASDGLCIADEQGSPLDVSDVLCTMLGYPREALLGMNIAQWDMCWSGAEWKAALQRMHDAASHTTVFESMYKRKDGSVFDVETTVIGFELESRPMLFMSSRDISERKRVQEQIRRQAHYDALTGVPNRSLFYDRLAQGIVLAKRERYELALLFLDLDKFKTVNDTLGHEAGDEVLRATATRVRHLLRESDTVARIGGDEFTVILPRIAGRADAAEVAARIVAALALPIEVCDLAKQPRRLSVACSVGIAIFPGDADGPDALVVAADAAMYDAKRAGGGFRFRADVVSR